MSDERFDYARKQLNAAAESSAEHITWVICQETGKHIGNDVSDRLARERLAREIESFLRN
jgi:hypothetical protein